MSRPKSTEKLSIPALDPARCRAARGFLNWSQSELVERSGVSPKTIADFERGASRPYRRTLIALEEAFKAAGIEFIRGGLRLRSSRGMPPSLKD